MQSSGGLIDLQAAAGHAALTVLSGPAAGAAGAAFAARAAGISDALCFDMGGTSCDVCVVDGGAVQEQSSGVSDPARSRCRCWPCTRSAPAAGRSPGGTRGGALRVGPRSAGADPGPACYGRGGHEPTVTDANVVLGHLDSSAPLAGGVQLDRAAAVRAVGALAAALGLSTEACAVGIRRVACAEMVGALRVVSVNRGVDPGSTRCWRSAAPARCTRPTSRTSSACNASLSRVRQACWRRSGCSWHHTAVTRSAACS